MKTKNIKKMTCLLSMALILCLSLFGGCKKNGADEKEGVVLLSSLPENPEYSSFPLIGTQWRLVGFVDARHNTIKLAEPLRKESYLLIFEGNGLVNGYTSSNKAGGKYAIDSSQELIINLNMETYAGENIDGYRYIEALNKVSSYRVSTRGLSLYYEKDIYLLFHPVEQ